MDEVNSALKGVHAAIAARGREEPSKKDERRREKAQWKCGEAMSGTAVAWETESCNTAPDVFVWESNKPTVLVATPGIYRTSLAFFSQSRLPSAQLLINSEVVLCTAPTGAVGPRPLQHSASLQEFIALPACARVSVVFTGKGDAEGFLELRKI